MKKLFRDKSIIRKDRLPCIFFILIVFLFHVLMGPDRNDGIVFGNSFKEYGLSGIGDYLLIRWQTWTGRLLIDSLCFIFSGTEYLFFKIADFFVCCLFGFLFIRIFTPVSRDLSGKNEEISLTWVSVLLLLQYPIRAMNSAGWIATMINYIWPLTAGCFVILYMLRIRRGRRCSGWYAAGAILACVFAADTEQMCAVLLAASSFCILDALLHKENRGIFVVFFVIAAAEFAVHFICPGNANRIVKETESYYQPFVSLTVPGKIYVGFARVMNYYTEKLSPIALLFFFSLGICVSKRKKSVLNLLLAWIPFMILLWQPVIASAFPQLSVFFRALNREALFFSKRNIYYTAVCVVFIAVTVIDIFIGTEDFRRGLLLLWIIAAGFATAVMMGFSPTVYASGERTMIYMQMAFIAGTALLIRDERMGKYQRCLRYALPVLTLFSLADNLFYLLKTL